MVTKKNFNRGVFTLIITLLSCVGMNADDGQINGHGYVDLGLSSGLKWATCNIGATAPSAFGSYFTWGEITSHSVRYGDNNKEAKPYLGDISGDSQYDAATAIWGGKWRMPTKAELKELHDKCQWTWTKKGKICGYKVVGPNGKSIFLPVAQKEGKAIRNFHSYWSSTQHEEEIHCAYCTYFDAKEHQMTRLHIINSYVIRPVIGTEPNRPPILGKPAPANSINGHQYVDLGLPSGLKWSKYNIGATYPWEYGDYFAWGETSTKNEYLEENSKTYNKDIDDISGNPQYDAARANWGDEWRIPTEAEIQELIKECKWEWTTQGVHYKGYKITGPSGKSIFLPAGGERYSSSHLGRGEKGNYWSSAPYGSETDQSCRFVFYSPYDYNLRNILWDFRYNGYSIRPVIGTKPNRTSVLDKPKAVVADNKASTKAGTKSSSKTGNKINGHEYVDLGLPSGIKWATCNVGASHPTEHGNRYAWGETKTPMELLDKKPSMPDVDDISGNPRYDAVRANWGGSWRMPRLNDLMELDIYCEDKKLVHIKGELFLKVTGPNGNSIYFPNGIYWTSTLREGEIMCFRIPDMDEYEKKDFVELINLGTSIFVFAHSIRPVSD